MKPSPVTLPPHCRQRVDPELATCIVGVGNVNLLAEHLLVLIASRECPGHVFLETVVRVPQWILKDGELGEATVNSELIVRQEGDRQVQRQIKVFNPDMTRAKIA